MEDYEKKYKEVLGRARTFSQRWDGIKVTDSELALKELKEIFPELKENDDEDERTRVSLLKYLKDSFNFDGEIIYPEVSNWISWLEEQTIDISSFPEEQRKYMEKYVNLDKTTLVKLLAERDENIDEVLNCEIKPRFKAGDVISDGYSTVTIDGINKDGYIISNGETENDSNAVNWIIHFEDQDRWKLLEQKYPLTLNESAWSEEDEIYLQDVVEWVTNYIDDEDCGDMTYDEHKAFYMTRINWLRSLKEKRTWKPSKEQIIALRWVLNNVPYNKHKEELVALLDQIKNL